MSNDRYVKPTFREICKQRDAVHFFAGHEISAHGERLWIALAETEKSLGLQYYR